MHKTKFPVAEDLFILQLVKPFYFVVCKVRYLSDAHSAFTKSAEHNLKDLQRKCSHVQKYRTERKNLR